MGVPEEGGNVPLELISSATHNCYCPGCPEVVRRLTAILLRAASCNDQITMAQYPQPHLPLEGVVHC